MGQTPVCSICSEQEKEQTFFNNNNNNLLIIEDKDVSLMDRPILKENKNTTPLNIKYLSKKIFLSC